MDKDARISELEQEVSRLKASLRALTRLTSVSNMWKHPGLPHGVLRLVRRLIETYPEPQSAWDLVDDLGLKTHETRTVYVQISRARKVLGPTAIRTVSKEGYTVSDEFYRAQVQPLVDECN